ncbi:MAG: DEAD/DEAH box helicase family protein [Nitrospirae bacterium]|nr:DEAD/DEAH box helicase family protein [Nitrospirota bacterium]
MSFKKREDIINAIFSIKKRLTGIDAEREKLVNELNELQTALADIESASFSSPTASVTAQSSTNKKIALFRILFRGREDVYPKFWISKKTGAVGYSPVCENEWLRGICKKPSVKCGVCDNRRLSSLSDDVVRRHLEGNIIIGVYPMLEDETCYFLAVDFDKQNWQEDAKAFLTTCRNNNIPSSLERSRSGNGGHVWIFFSEPVSSSLARQLGSYLITETMSQRHELDMKSYDRLFPNQDTLPKGGFGNLIALPLQKAPMEKGNSIFLDDDLIPYSDQWAYLSEIKKLSLKDIQSFVEQVTREKDIMDISMSQTDEEVRPWERSSSGSPTFEKLACELPSVINAVLATRVYIKKDGLPSPLLNKIKRLAAFQNPEFYKKQSMRLSTALTPRVICCAEELQNYITIPRGCVEGLSELCSVNQMTLNIQDKRVNGNAGQFTFTGDLTETQEKSCRELLKHATGTFVAPPGIGKTVIGIKLIAARGVNTLVLVHRKPLLEQWCTQIATFLNIPVGSIGQIGGGKNKATNAIDVAMIQSLDKKEEVDHRIRNYGQIIVDECHHVSAFSFERVMMEANARYIVGLTATPYRRDGHHPIITMQCGPVRYKVTPRKDTAGSSLKYRLMTRTTNFAYPWSDGDNIQSLWQPLVMDENRNHMIFDDILNSLEEKRSPIVLTERKEHLELLKQKLEKFVKHIIVLHGGMRAGTRKEMLSKLESIPDTEERLILATGQYIGEGFDDPRLDTLFITMPFSFKGKMVQYAGRLHRLYQGKTEVRIYDYVDENIPVLMKMYKRRLKAYKALGYVEKAIM